MEITKYRLGVSGKGGINFSAFIFHLLKQAGPGRESEKFSSL